MQTRQCKFFGWRHSNHKIEQLLGDFDVDHCRERVYSWFETYRQEIEEILNNRAKETRLLFETDNKIRVRMHIFCLINKSFVVGTILKILFFWTFFCIFFKKSVVLQHMYLLFHMYITFVC